MLLIKQLQWHCWGLANRESKWTAIHNNRPRQWPLPSKLRRQLPWRLVAWVLFPCKSECTVLRLSIWRRKINCVAYLLWAICGHEISCDENKARIKGEYENHTRLKRHVYDCLVWNEFGFRVFSHRGNT